MLRCARTTLASAAAATAGATPTTAVASVVCTAGASHATTAARAYHSSRALGEKRMVDGTWVSDNTRARERRHFDPPQPPPVVKRPPRELFPSTSQHHKIEPYVQPVANTHTIMKQRKDIRMQFQLEPVTRTNVKGDAAAGNARIHDYERAEVFTRAPWPAYREIILNRPKHLHSLSPAMIQQMTHLLHSIQVNKDISAALMISRHLPPEKLPADAPAALKARRPYEKTFCSGMDMQTLLTLIKKSIQAPKAAGAQSQSQQTGNPELSKYFRSLYSLAFAMSHVRTPLVVAMDGLTIGAGAGFALQTRYRVATENTRISFPQATFGWFPDAGASYILPRLDGKMGLFLALTGWQVRGLDAMRLGFGTHYCESDELHRFGRRMGDSSLNYQFAEDTIEQAFGMFSSSGPSHFPLPIHDLHEVLNDVFDAESVEAILTKMVTRVQRTMKRGERASPKEKAVAAFLEECQKRMMASSPTGLKVTFELLRLTQWLPLEKCLKLEYRLSQNLLSNLANPLTADIFNAPNFGAKTLAQVTPAMMDLWFHENPNPDMEIELDYPAKQEPHWYI